MFGNLELIEGGHMELRQIKPGILLVGAIDWDRRLFDALIPLPDGTSYNSYLIRGSRKIALVDTVDPSKTDILLSNLKSAGVENLDYVVTNHAEQDHSGSLPAVLSAFPEAQVVTTPKCKEILMYLLLIPENRITTVEDKETLSLGDKTLEFIHYPWVHWPDTMLTYLREDKILFPCDFFGSHLATSDMYATDEGRVYEAAKRYYAEIMMPFRTNIQRQWDKLKDYDIQIIAPSHGPMHNRPAFIMDAYRDWVAGPPKNSVVIPYVSMHGSTRLMVEYLTRALAARGIKVEVFDLPASDIGKLAMSLVDAATVIIGTPTVLSGAHPAAVYAAVLANAFRPKVKFASVVGSYSWGGRAVEQLTALIPNLKVELIPPVVIQGLPQEADYRALDEMADVVLAKHKESKLV
jgi:flavorubredoxin